MTADAGGERAAGISSLVETAQLNGRDPEAIWAISSAASPITPSTVSPSCCPGASPRTPAFLS
jgi:hypothetical protein